MNPPIGQSIVALFNVLIIFMIIILTGGSTVKSETLVPFFLYTPNTILIIYNNY